MIIILSVFFCAFFTINHERLAKYFNIYDIPDNKRKFHVNKVALTGGVLIFLNFLLLELFIINNIQNINVVSVFRNEHDFFIFSISLVSIFLLGIFDDKYEIPANLKFIFMILIAFITVVFSEDLLIKKIDISFLSNVYELSTIYSVFWTVTCFLLFLNALNMFDGINYQIAIYSIFISVFFLLNNYFVILFLLLLISLIFFTYLNHKNKAFLGDSGSYLLAFLFSYFFVKFYNQTGSISTDQIVLFMLIPGLDLMRLFVLRIYNRKSPFFPDRNHLHHILLYKFSLIQTNILIFSLISVPSTLSYLFGYSYFFLMIQIFLYFILILKYK